MRKRFSALIAGTLLYCAAAPYAQDEPQFVNLKVLPDTISRDELGDVMLENLRGLGLPRRQSQGCLFCHVGDSETPSSTWDFAADDKPEKRTARDMMAMVADINRRLAKLDNRISPDLEVTCYTCHAGRTDPRPLPVLLNLAYDRGGADGLIGAYRRLRQRYFGADAYDFRPAVLAQIALQLADAGAYEDALAIAVTNRSFNPDVGEAAATEHVIRMESDYAHVGLDLAIDRFDALRADENATWTALDTFGWRLERRGRGQDALRVFRRNLALFPDQYIPNESLGDALWFIQEDLEAAIALFERWLERHPDHEMARRRLATLRANR